MNIKPLTKGNGEQSFTLFYPFSVLEGAAPFNISELILHLKRRLPDTYGVESIEGKGRLLLRISGLPTHEDAANIFNIMNRILLYLSIESDIAIYIFDSLADIEKPFAYFPGSWPDGINAGWTPEIDRDLIRIDGMAHTIFPVIVPEHLRIVDSGAGVGRLCKIIKTDLYPNAIKFSHYDKKETAYYKGELAAKAYINAFSHDNPHLRFLSLVTCLEILSEPKDRSEVFQKVVKDALKAVKNINFSNDEEKLAYDKILSLVGNLKKQSKREALEDLVNDSKEIICKSLPNDHPHKNNPMGAIDEMYKIRSKVAHNGVLGKRITNEILRSKQFAHCARV